MTVVGVQTPLKLCLRLFGSQWRTSWRLCGGVIFFAVAQAAAVAASSYLNGSWHLQGGKGFREHYGAWAILISDPLLVIAGGLLYRQFRVTMAVLPLAPGRRGDLSRLCRPWLSAVKGQGNSWLLYVLCVLVGVAAWAVNVLQTLHPSATYGHDVFDSSAHSASFVTFKIALFVSWVIVYPVVGYIFIYVAAGTQNILREAGAKTILNPYVEHPDGCYGFRCVGNLNLTILLPYLIAMFTLLMIFDTHRTYYASIVFPAIIIVFIFLFLSFSVIWPVHSILFRARAESYRRVVAASRRNRRATGPDSYKLLVDRFHYSSSTPSPYSQSAKAAVAVMRLAPLVTFAWKLIG